MARLWGSKSAGVWVVLLAGFLGNAGLVAQQPDLPALTDNQQQAMSEINQNRITATISFLASDELGGRDTPSTGLDIASAYVASRFRGAGLKGLGDEGSYYQTTEVDTVQMPATATVTSGENSVDVLGVLGAGSEPFVYAGAATRIDPAKPMGQAIEGPVVIAVPEFTERQSAVEFSRLLNKLQQQGATAFLLETSPEHPLVGQASQGQKPRLSRSRGGLARPSILVSAGSIHDDVAIQLAGQVAGTAVVKNVIGVLEGTDPELAQEAIIFSAHLDHIGTIAGDGDTINNGADDDATGVTAVLSLADAYAALDPAPRRSIIFMTFWGEEKGLLGSTHYADDPAWPLDKTVANLNLEMLGRPEPGANEKVWMTGWDQSTLGPLMKRGADRAGVLVFEHPSFSAALYRRSDNFSFVKKGVIAHSFSAGSLHDDYHQPTDEWEKLRLDHMTSVVRGLFAGSLPLAEGQLTPEKTEQRR